MNKVTGYRYVYVKNMGKVNHAGKTIYQAIEVSTDPDGERHPARGSAPARGTVDVYIDIDNPDAHISPAYVYGICRAAPL